MRYELELPYPPSNNTLFTVARGRKIKSGEGRNYQNLTYWLIREQKANFNITSRISVAIHAFMPDKRRRDLDNIPKAVLDALTNGGVYADDEQIDELKIVREKITKPGKLKIIITEMSN